MTNIRKNRLILLLIGFFLLIIPLVFFCYSLNNLYDFTKEKEKENLRQKILSTVKNIEENLNPYNYLKIEFNKIHSKLIPDFPNEILAGIPEDSYINNIYNKAFAEKVFNLTIKRFSPIIITVGNNNIAEIYTYFSPELEKELKVNNVKNKLLDAKIYYDYDRLEQKAEHYFNKNFNYSPYITYLCQNKAYKNYKKVCYDYFSRFSSYNRNLGPIYTDYFKNQTLYPILKYTISKKGIHGYYSLLIPQGEIDPDSILNTAISNKTNEINIQLVRNKAISHLEETKFGYEYYLNFTTDFISHVNAYKRLKGIDKTELLNNQFKVSIKYPEELTKLFYLKKTSEIICIITPIFYIFISFIFLKYKKVLHISIIKKLISILCIIILLPIMGIGISTWMYSKNIDDLLDYNIAQNLNNELNHYYTINQENNLRYLSYIFELKRKIAKGTFLVGIPLYESILTPQETETWYKHWSTNTHVFSEDESVFYFSTTDESYDILHSNSRELKFYKIFFLRFLNNLGLLKTKTLNKKNDFSDTFSLGFLEKYLTQEIEESTFPLESIPQKDIFNFVESNLAVFFYAKDKNNKSYFMYERKHSSNIQPYQYINKYYEKINPFWFKPSNDFSDIEMGVKLFNHNEEKNYQWPTRYNMSQELNDLLSKAIYSKDSGSEKNKSSSKIQIKQWIFTDNDPYVIAGIANSKNYSNISTTINMVFPILLAYAVLLLTTLTGFISIFVTKPINIYKKALRKLNENKYGITINSFSKDEFNNITKAFNEMSIAIRQKEQIKRFVSEKLIKSVDNKDILEAGQGKIEKLTILSSDIRNFTGISEIYEPSVIVEMLNTYFTQMQEAISQNGGIIDKYIGDAIQAVFYDESNKENHVIRAAKAALAMRKALNALNKKREDSGLFTIENGIGIDTDFAITGTVGTNNGRKDYSVNGDVITRAAKLESKTKLTESKILISKNSLKAMIHQNSSQSYTIIDSGQELFCGNATNNSIQQLNQIIYKNFDETSVELIDVN